MIGLSDKFFRTRSSPWYRQSVSLLIYVQAYVLTKFVSHCFHSKLQFCVVWHRFSVHRKREWVDGWAPLSFPSICLLRISDGLLIAVGCILHSLLHYPTCLMDLWVLELAGSLSIWFKSESVGGLESFLPIWSLCMGTLWVSLDTLTGGSNFKLHTLVQHHVIGKGIFGFSLDLF